MISNKNRLIITGIPFNPQKTEEAPHIDCVTVYSMKNLSIVLVGDSDISRWPPSLYPKYCKINNNVKFDVVNLGQSGGVLSDLLPQLHQWQTEQRTRTGIKSSENIHIFVACAGENDLGSGRSVDGLLNTFRSFLDELFPDSQLQQKHVEETKNFLLFLGPKFEPWLSEDSSSRKQYAKLSNALQRTIRKHSAFHTHRMTYIDSITTFCTKETSQVPGAIHGGRAIPDVQFFDRDGLHLNEKGYQIWNHMIEEELCKIMDREEM